jgi:hypothetical protein
VLTHPYQNKFHKGLYVYIGQVYHQPFIALASLGQRTLVGLGACTVWTP